MFKTVKKILLGNNSKEANSSEVAKISLGDKIQQKAQGFIKFIQDRIEESKSEFGDIKSKMSNLLETNYQLGLRHLAKGNISDAIFRFRFIKKFWPNCFDAYYQLAYCLVLNKRVFEAKKILKELLEKDPNYDPKAKALLENLNQESKI